MSIGIIISTYNNPVWLEKTLWGYISQTRPADEIIIADDGSTSDTQQLIERYADLLPLKHVWHEDNGFRKTKILNEALRVATADYLIFTDQDCVPRCDFVATHEKLAKPRTILSGGYFKLPMNISQQLSRHDIESQQAFKLSWLRSQGLPTNFKCTKLIQNTCFAKFMNTITPTRATWNGMNSSTWRELILQVRGFDERMQYGGEDREMGERLFNLDIQARQIRYSAIVLHLDHARPYVNEEAWERNRAIRQETQQKHLTQTQYGL